jgi:Ca-activated chloride channel family protein
MKSPSLVSVLSTLWLAAALAAQDAPRFRATVGLVVLHATVKDSHGRLVTNLDRSAFTVYENGKPQAIALFGREDVPVSLGLVIDNSGSMRLARARMEAAALALVGASNPQDEAFVVNFADKPRLDVPWTSDVETLRAGIARVDAIGGTALYDAVDMAQAYAHAGASRDRKVLVVISDGNDNASETTIAHLQDSLAERGIAVYAVGLARDQETMQRGRHALDQLTKQTGGLAYYPADLDGIGPAALEIAQQIRNQYTIAYEPTNQTLDGSYRAIHVQARGQGRLTVVTRPGYQATPGSPPSLFTSAPAPSRPPAQSRAPSLDSR